MADNEDDVLDLTDEGSANVELPSDDVQIVEWLELHFSQDEPDDRLLRAMCVCMASAAHPDYSVAECAKEIYDFICGANDKKKNGDAKDKDGGNVVKFDPRAFKPGKGPKSA